MRDDKLTGRGMLAVWGSGVLATLQAAREGNAVVLAELETNARNALIFAQTQKPPKSEKQDG
jgi:hypothetical protein